MYNYVTVKPVDTNISTDTQLRCNSFTVKRSLFISVTMKREIILLLLYLHILISISSSYEEEATVAVDENDYAEPTIRGSSCGEYNREQRGKLNGTPWKSRIVDAMMSTKMLTLKPDAPDILSFLRDKYELPKGKYILKFFLKLLKLQTGNIKNVELINLEYLSIVSFIYTGNQVYSY